MKRFSYQHSMTARLPDAQLEKFWAPSCLAWGPMTPAVCCLRTDPEAPQTLPIDFSNPDLPVQALEGSYRHQQPAGAHSELTSSELNFLLVNFEVHIPPDTCPEHLPSGRHQSLQTPSRSVQLIFTRSCKDSPCFGSASRVHWQPKRTGLNSRVARGGL